MGKEFWNNMKTKYWGNSGNLCFLSSLTNLLIDLEDFQTAEEVVKKYFDSPLISKNLTMNCTFMTRAVRDLTSNRYKATLYMNLDNIQGLREVYNENTHKTDVETLINIAQEEIKNNNIRPYIECIIKSINSRYPNIYSLYDKNRKIFHAVVARSDKVYIDDGNLTTFDNLLQRGFKKAGVLDVKPNLQN